jgi:hypothetical protein
MQITAGHRSKRRHRRGAVVLAALVLVAAAAGAWLVFAGSQPQSDPMALRAGNVTYSVTHVERVAGLSDQDLSGMGHGVQGLVAANQAMVRVTLRVDAGSKDTTYDPAALRLRDNRGGALTAPSGGSLAAARLGANGQIEGSVAFVVPRSGEHLTLQAEGAPDSVDIGDVDVAAPDSATHSHGSTPSTTDSQLDPFAVDPPPPGDVPK